jgi:hypothetical protein
MENKHDEQIGILSEVFAVSCYIFFLTAITVVLVR